MPVHLIMNIKENSSYAIGSLVSERGVFKTFGKAESKRRWVERGHDPKLWEPKFIKLTVTDLDFGSTELQPLKPNSETGRPVRFLALTGDMLSTMYPDWREYYEISESWTVISEYIRDLK